MKFLVGILIFLVIILTGTVAYLAGRQNIALLPSPSPTSSAVILEKAGPTPLSSPSLPSPIPITKVVQGGGILSFPRYQLTIPSNWTSNRENNTKDDEKITVSNGIYKITILQGGFGGGICLYPGDPDSVGLAGRFSTFVELTTNSGDKLRRSIPENGKGFGICQLLTQYGYWGSPTLYGDISLTTPSTPTTKDLNVVDSILKSITKL